jgi:hypothetical protein
MNQPEQNQQDAKQANPRLYSQSFSDVATVLIAAGFQAKRVMASGGSQDKQNANVARLDEAKPHTRESQPRGMDETKREALRVYLTNSVAQMERRLASIRTGISDERSRLDSLTTTATSSGIPARQAVGKGNMRVAHDEKELFSCYRGPFAGMVIGQYPNNAIRIYGGLLVAGDQYSPTWYPLDGAEYEDVTLSTLSVARTYLALKIQMTETAVVAAIEEYSTLPAQEAGFVIVPIGYATLDSNGDVIKWTQFQYGNAFVPVFWSIDGGGCVENRYASLEIGGPVYGTYLHKCRIEDDCVE